MQNLVDMYVEDPMQKISRSYRQTVVFVSDQIHPLNIEESMNTCKIGNVRSIPVELRGRGEGGGGGHVEGRPK